MGLAVPWPGVSRDIWQQELPTLELQYPQCPLGHIKVSDYSALGEEKREGRERGRGWRGESAETPTMHRAVTRPLEQVHPLTVRKLILIFNGFHKGP